MKKKVLEKRGCNIINNLNENSYNKKNIIQKRKFAFFGKFNLVFPNNIFFVGKFPQSEAK